jgi:hypothetical protein
MPARSITDEEIGLIKAMIGQKMKNKDIQFFFNRPDRPVNSGRISGIAKGTYSNSADIPPANAKKLKEFVDKQSAVGPSGAIVVATAPGAPAKGPMSPEALKDLFEEVGVGIDWRLKAGETDEHECKESFGIKHAHNWLRPMAALANNRGGYLLFGVYDKGKKGPNGEDLSHIVCGMKSEEFVKTDPVEFTKKVKSMFDPTPHFAIGMVTVGGNTVGVIHVVQHASRPVIATRREGDIREGDIYFRYPGQSARIKYSDLRAILDDRDTLARAAILPMVEQLLALGPARAVVADLKEGTLGDGNRTLQIDETLLDKIAFIKEGEFHDKDGAPTLRLVGDVVPVGAAATHIKKGAVTRADLINDFLTQNTDLDPKEFIRFAVEGMAGTWVPIRYYAKLANLAKPELIAFIHATNSPPGRKTMFASRIGKKNSAWVKPSVKSAAILDTLEKTHVLPEPATSKDAGSLARALQGLARTTTAPLKTLLAALSSCVKLTVTSYGSDVRRAMCRIDEIFFDF